MKMVQKISILYLCAIGLLSWGIAIGKYGVFPHDYLEKIKTALTNENIKEKIDGLPWNHLALENPVLSLDPRKVIWPDETYLLVTGMFDRKNAIRLLGNKGRVIKEWVFHPDRAFAMSPKDRFNVDLHGSVVFPDGSAMANFEYEGTVKLDKCNSIEWQVPNTHHSIFHSPRNTFWIPGQRKRNKKMKTLKPPFKEDLIMEVDSQGTILRSISILDVIYQNDLQGLLFSNGFFEVENFSDDFLHINDIEELTPDKAHVFPQLSPGDVMVSVRHLNLILIFDPNTLDVKWYQIGPWLRQHDPDFQDDGTITIFDNNSDNASGSTHGGSKIIKIDPVTRNITTLYKADNFYSRVRGKHTILKNGHILIVEFSRGRVFVVDPNNGKVNFEYTNPNGTGQFYKMSNAEFIDKSFFMPDFKCE